MFSYLLLLLAIAGTVGSAVFLALAILAAMRFRRESPRWDVCQGEVPPVSVIKPVHGVEPRLRENLESFFQQDHPQYELLFCARTPDNPALQVAIEVAAKYPQRNVKFLACG